ncbi:uncharacterized protein LOC142224044 [Haematobia irritans]|uniref:uncharacterized protein LOC142224044 n=1 Tax=Haematobia irritans TaxID=7368 RepID=UPI003F4F57E2
MNMLVNFICIAYLALQLCLAAPTPETTTNGPLQAKIYQKRYDIFDSILLQINHIAANTTLVLTTSHPTILDHYDEWLKANKDNIDVDKVKLYEALTSNLQTLLKTKASLKTDPHNCELQRQLHKAFFTAESTRRQIDNKDVDAIWKKYKTDDSDDDIDEKKAKEQFAETYFIELEKQFDSFLELLDDAGKEDNKEFIKWYNEFQSKTDVEEKYDAFGDIDDFFEEELERETKAGHVNCRLTAQLEWREYIFGDIINAIFSAFASVAKKITEN